MIQKFYTIMNCQKLFSSPIDMMKFIKIAKPKGTKSKLYSFRLKEVKQHPLFVRSNTSDVQVLKDTFIEKYHVPSFPLQEQSTILDLGANVGYTMAHFAYLYPKSRIIGVELDNTNFLLAKKNLKSLKNQCTIINAGIWSSNGTISYEGNSACGYKISKDSDHSKFKGNSKTLSIDWLLKYYNIEKVDFMKMDIEGAEYEILKQPDKWIDNIKSLKMEIHPPASFKWCFNILEKYGFECIKDTFHPNAIIATKPNR